jgi:hypothetical protein
MSDFYDMHGMPISLERWAELFEQTEQRKLAVTDVFDDGRCEVSTVWLGLNHQYGLGQPPLIFESLVFYADGGTSSMQRYATRELALEGHAALVAELRAAAAAVDNVDAVDNE